VLRYEDKNNIFDPDYSGWNKPDPHDRIFLCDQRVGIEFEKFKQKLNYNNPNCSNIYLIILVNNGEHIEIERKKKKNKGEENNI
jgi:hypothetical protein